MSFKRDEISRERRTTRRARRERPARRAAPAHAAHARRVRAVIRGRAERSRERTRRGRRRGEAPSTAVAADLKMSLAYADRLEPRTGAVFSPATNVDRAALRGLEFLRRPIPPGARGAKAGTSGARPTMSLENVAPLNPATMKREVCEVGRAPPLPGHGNGSKHLH